MQEKYVVHVVRLSVAGTRRPAMCVFDINEGEYVHNYGWSRVHRQIHAALAAGHMLQ